MIFCDSFCIDGKKYRDSSHYRVIKFYHNIHFKNYIHHIDIFKHYHFLISSSLSKTTIWGMGSKKNFKFQKYNLSIFSFEDANPDDQLFDKKFGRKE